MAGATCARTVRVIVRERICTSGIWLSKQYSGAWWLQESLAVMPEDHVASGCLEVSTGHVVMTDFCTQASCMLRGNCTG